MLIDLRIKAALLGVFLILTAISFYNDNIGLSVFFLIPVAIMFLLVNIEIQTKSAAGRIRNMISGKGYSQTETEDLTWRIISILKEDDAKKPVKYSKEWSNWLPEFASSLTRWASFTQSDLASALETALILEGKK